MTATKGKPQPVSAELAYITSLHKTARAEQAVIRAAYRWSDTPAGESSPREERALIRALNRLARITGRKP